MRLALLAFIFVPAVAVGQSPEETKATIAYIQSLQLPDGAFVGSKVDANAKAAPSLRATSAAIRALKYFGGELQHKDKVEKFVVSCFDPKTGGYSDSPGGTPDVFLTAVGLMARDELKNVDKASLDSAVKFLSENAKNFEDIRIAAAGFEAAKTFPKPKIDEWIEQTNKMQNKDGSFGQPEGDARMTGSAVALILRVGGKLPQPDASLKVLLAGQRDDGGYGKADVKTSDLETSYRVMRAFHMLKEKPKDVAKLKEFVVKCRNADGGYGVEPGKPSNIGATYYASIISYWLK